MQTSEPTLFYVALSPISQDWFLYIVVRHSEIQPYFESKTPEPTL